MHQDHLTTLANGKPTIINWLTEKEVAAITRISISTLRAHRFNGRGIPYAKLGRSVRYSAAEVQKYMSDHQIYPRTEQ